MAQKLGHRYRWPLTLAAALAGAASCTEAPTTEPYIKARPAATQPAGSGDTVDENEACDRIREAEEDTRTRLQCRDLERPPCPAYVRPAGSGCWDFDEASVTACEQVIAGYESCGEFDDQPCVLTAIESDESCPAAPIVGGAGGVGGAQAEGGSPGDGGSPPMTTGGAAGESNAGASNAGASLGGAGGQGGGGAGGGV